MAEQEYSYRWRPIEDLTERDLGEQHDELAALAKVWREQKQRLQGKMGDVDAFNEKLIRSWSIETGVIERVYNLDRGITEVLVERGLDAVWITRDSTNLEPKLVAAILSDHRDTIEGLFDFVKGNRTLTTSCIKELHAQLTRHQDDCEAVDQFGNRGRVSLLKGAYKRLKNNPSRSDGTVHEYCPPEHVDSEMERLIALHTAHTATKVAPELESAWLHHRFTQIHPFQDGNGRVARCLATLVMLRADWFPLVVTRDDNAHYMDCLEEADRDDLGSLTVLFASLERTAFVQALAIVPEAIKSTSLTSEIEAIGQELRQRKQRAYSYWEKAKDIASELHRAAIERFESLTADLTRSIGAIDTTYTFKVESEDDRGQRRFWHQQAIFEAGRSLRYFVNTGSYHSWVRLDLGGTPETNLLVSIHGIGHDFRGVLAISGLLYRRARGDDGRMQLSEVVPLADAIFQVNYHDDPVRARARFEEWLDQILHAGIKKWRENL